MLFLYMLFRRFRAKRNDDIYWVGLRMHMTITYIWVTLVFLALILSVRLTIFVLLREPRSDLFPSLIIVLTVPGLASIDAFIAGFFATRSPVKRVQHLVAATKQFADGNYAQRVQVTRRDEIGQLEQHFNQMAEQLAESIVQRQALAEQNARLAERSRLARDLHDSVKQHLFAVSMQVGAALAQVEQSSGAGAQVSTAGDAARAHLLEADTLVSQAQQELTALIHELRPSVLQQKGLPTALREYAQDWSRQHSIAVELDVSEGSAVPLAIEDAFWRIAQEALSNAARHSQATSVQVSLKYAPDQVTLSVADNGHGFEPGSGQQTGVGLHSMRERMAGVGGTVTIQSRPGEGTSVLACCPLLQGVADVHDATRKAVR
ncbi:MAG TPA: sensor histidine kinase [Ktedonobacterales bacterium]|nr:sensor histidine kinase [Ktedonobacterales bacterium]